MKRLAPLAALVAGLIVLLGIGWEIWTALRPPPPPPSSPHVILLSMDTTRRDHFSFYGYDKNTTPRLGELARESVVFEDAVAAHTNTAPSHASAMTGLYPAAHGILRNGYRLRQRVPTLAETLRAQGYATAGVVNGFTLRAKVTDLHRGFDIYQDETAPGAKTHREVLDLLDKHPTSQPLFLFFHLFEPHAPYVPSDADLAKFLPPNQKKDQFPRHPQYRRIRTQGPKPGEIAAYTAKYDAEIHAADRYFGAVLDRLRERGMFEHAIIVFMADHGETLGERRWALDHGGQAYDEQARIPLMIKTPTNQAARIKGPTHHIDITPTVLDVLGFERPGQAPTFHGQSLKKYLTGPAAGDVPPRTLYTHARPEPHRVPHIKARLHKKGLVTALRHHPLKLIAYPGPQGPTYELFNVATDPGEITNLAPTEPETVQALAERLQTWQGAVGDLSKPMPELSAETRESLRALGYVE